MGRERRALHIYMLYACEEVCGELQCIPYMLYACEEVCGESCDARVRWMGKMHSAPVRVNGYKVEETRGEFNYMWSTASRKKQGWYSS